MSVSVLIPTLDEELHLERCLLSLRGLSTDIWVVDSGSTDRTLEIARRFSDSGVQVVHHDYAGPAEQKNWALDELPWKSAWILILDADESVSPPLKDAIEAAVRDPKQIVGWRIARRILFHGRWIRHGGWYPSWNLRLFRRGSGRYERRRVHEHLMVDGPVAEIEGDLIHEDLRGLAHQIEKHCRYARSEALEAESLSEGQSDGYARLWTKDPLARRRWLKTRILYRMPGRALLFFAYSYFLRRGFLDGLTGLRFHVLQAIFKHFDALFLLELRRERAAAAQEAESSR